MKKREGSKTNIAMTKNKSESKQDQPHLPNDIVRLIMEKIPWKERFRLSFVCKSWKELFDEIQDTEEFLPLVMCFDWNEKSDGGTCKLYNPSTQTSYTVKEPPGRELFYGARLHDSRWGWVLFSKKISEPCFNHYLYFLYSPFTNKIIKFPKLKIEQIGEVARISLNNSGLPHCMVAALSYETRKLSFKICHPGDESWKTFKVGDNMGNLQDVVYTGEICYCLFSSRKLVAFDVKQQQWKLLSQQYPKKMREVFSTYCGIRMSVTFNGDLILLAPSSCRDRLWISWRFDLSRNKWVVAGHKIRKKQVIFISTPNVLRTGTTSIISVPAVGNARASAGEIFYADGYASSWLCPFLPKQSKIYEWIEDDSRHLRKYWIQPPFPNPFKTF